MNRIAVLTSGGDAPGMNAAIRAVARAGSQKEMKIFGVRLGYEGLINGDLIPLKARNVGGIIHLGGTMLGSARSKEFRTEAGRKRALATLAEHRIDALVVIGGSGSQLGAYELSEMGFPVVGIASTIDNDLFGSEMTIGVDTALNIALESIDRLKVTASSHHRAFLVEVMGRDSGYLALMSAIAGGAETVAIPEVDSSPQIIAAALRDAHVRGKTHGLVVVAEGATFNAAALAQHHHDHPEEWGFDLRVTTLGHVQRGGIPSAFDRILAARLGVAAIEYLANDKHGALMGLQRGGIEAIPLKDVAHNKKEIDIRLFEMARTLAT